MTEFRPISPADAVELLAAAQLGEAAAQLLVDWAEAGVIKGYARLIETNAPGGGCESVRDKRIPGHLWRRVAAEGRASDVATTGTVRLVGSDLTGGPARVSIFGIRFDGPSLSSAADLHGKSRPKTPERSRMRETDASPIANVAPPNSTAPFPPPKPAGRSPTTAPCPGAGSGEPDPLTVSIKQAGAMLGLGRTTINRLMDEGALTSVKLGGRRLIYLASVRALAEAAGSR